MSQRISATDFYAILNVPAIASDEQIKAAYRHLVRLHHPDANPNRRDEAEIHIKQIIEAYGILGDTQKRAHYDADRRLSSIENAESSSSRHAAHGRNHGEPQSLLGRVRWSLDIDSHNFAAQLGLADAVLLDMEARDMIPATPVQKRTFINLCNRAAQKLDEKGRHSDAEDLRAALRNKAAQTRIYR